jgi:dTDP-4-dehydrorhamnose reductase
MAAITKKFMKVLVTGSNGQLGSELRYLAPQYSDFQFIFTDIDELDITNSDAVRDCFDRETPDFVINCAAYTAVDRAEEDELNAYKLNAEAPKILSELARMVGAKLIHISTDYVFDGKSYTPYLEDFPTSPDSVYGKTKLAGEKFVSESGVGMVIRTAWLYSAFGKNFAKTIAQKGKESESLKVVYDQVGSPTWAHDLAKAILAIVQRGKDEFMAEVFHYSNEGVCSWFDFAIEIVSFFDYKCKILPILTSQYPTPAKRPHYSVLDKGKIKSTYGIVIPYWRESLERCLKSLTI